MNQQAKAFFNRQKWGRYTLLLVVLFLLFAWSSRPAAAQTYRFAVPELFMQVFVQPDASVLIQYDITFENQVGVSPIDIIDIGTPHRNYDIGNMKASINGIELSNIRRSEYVSPGVEIHLGQHAIPPGERGVFSFEFTMPDLVYQDTTRSDYASLQITPTWFDPSLVRGGGETWVVIHMLPEVEIDEVLYQDVPFYDKIIFQERVVVGFMREQPATGPFLVGVSFPQRGMERVVQLNIFQLAVKWLEDNPDTRTAIGALSFLLLSFLFFRFSGCTGFSLYVILAGGLVWLLAESAASQLILFPLLLLGIGVNEYHLSRRRLTYLPALATVEGGGIKRGLTAPEAAILLELPLNRVLTLVVFGLLKKGVLQQVEADPLTVAVNEPFQAAAIRSLNLRAKERRKAAQQAGVVLHKYEQPFLDLIEENAGRPIHQIDFSKPVEGLITHAAKRIAGFDLKETQEYYRKIISRAMTEAKSAVGDLPEWEKTVDRNMEWILMGDDYPPVFTHHGQPYRPVWIRHWPIGAGSATAAAGAPASKPAVGGRTSFSDVAASFAGWTENTMGRMAEAISPQMLQAATSKSGGLVDLRGADRLTADILKSMAESSGSGGGRSGGGGCACAGCACACACAGGGR